MVFARKSTPLAASAGHQLGARVHRPPRPTMNQNALTSSSLGRPRVRDLLAPTRRWGGVRGRVWVWVRVGVRVWVRVGVRVGVGVRVRVRILGLGLGLL